MSFPKPPPRPARPKVTDPELLRRAARLSCMEPHQICGAEETEIGLVMTFPGGAQSVYVPEDKPDAAGQKGLLQLRPPTGHKFSQQARIYQHHRTDDSTADNEPWSVSELDELARRNVNMPAWVRGDHGPTLLYWVDGCPVRARSAWLMVARQARMTPGYAAEIGRGDCNNYRKLIVDSGWIRTDEIHLLDHDETAEVQNNWREEPASC